MFSVRDHNLNNIQIKDRMSKMPKKIDPKGGQPFAKNSKVWDALRSEPIFEISLSDGSKVKARRGSPPSDMLSFWLEQPRNTWPTPKPLSAMTEEEMVEYLYQNADVRNLEARILESGRIDETVSAADGRQIEGNCRHAVRTRTRTNGELRFNAQPTVVLHPDTTVAQVHLIAYKEQVYTKSKWMSYAEAVELRLIMGMHGWSARDAYIILGGFHRPSEPTELLRTLDLIQSAEDVMGEPIGRNELFMHYYSIAKGPELVKYLLENPDDFRWLVKAINYGKFDTYSTLNKRWLMGGIGTKGIFHDPALRTLTMEADAATVVEKIKIDIGDYKGSAVLAKADTIIERKIREASSSKRGRKRMALKASALLADEDNKVESLFIKAARFLIASGKKSVVQKVCRR